MDKIFIIVIYLYVSGYKVYADIRSMVWEINSCTMSAEIKYKKHDDSVVIVA
jgi:hypothetical protein